ncbi:hypothetical protein M405DRAFT_26271 [Rhizopogon salebrosus TDB-379]|nr:hypothetical protein M405DRAFT_26271 [Rhizopogon salebrosus TDB-379]
MRLHLTCRRSRPYTRLYRFTTRTEAGCNNAHNDFHASVGDSFKDALPGYCETKKAGAVFSCVAFVRFCLIFLALTCLSLDFVILVILRWRAGNLATNHAYIPMQMFRRARSRSADTPTNPVTNSISTYQHRHMTAPTPQCHHLPTS